MYKPNKRKLAFHKSPTVTLWTKNNWL